jgi:hypothetical protein
MSSCSATREYRETMPAPWRLTDDSVSALGKDAAFVVVADDEDGKFEL